MDEMAADFTQELLTETRSFRQLMDRDTGVARRVLNAVKEFVAKVKKVFTGDKAAQNRAAVGTYGADLDTLERAVQLWGEALNEGTEAVRAQKNTAATEGSGEGKFSLKTADGKTVVWIENSSLTKKELNDHKAVADFIAEHIGEVYTIIESGQKVYIGEDLPGEYTQSKYTTYLKNRDRKGLRAKNKAIDGMGELIETATNRRWEKTKHSQNKDAKYGMYRYDSAFAFPVKNSDGQVQSVKAYDVELLIRNASDGKKYLYDIVSVKENTTAMLELLNKESRKGDREAAARGDVSANSVPQTEGKVNGQFSLKQYTEQEKKSHVKAALDHFGRTYSWKETGYLTPNGSKLDFSGKHEGGPGGYRTVDHRDIRDALGEDYGGEDYSGGMVQFMAEGNIRISPESGGINLSVMPTKAQMEALEDFVSRERGEVILDLDTTDGRTVSSTEYPRGTRASKVLADIRRYFESGETPYVSETAQFRYSLKGTGGITQEVAALRRENEMLKERAEYWKSQTRRTTPGMVDKKAVDKAAKELITMYGADLEVSEINTELKALYDYMGVKGEVNYDEVRRRAVEIAGQPLRPRLRRGHLPLHRGGFGRRAGGRRGRRLWIH